MDWSFLNLAAQELAKNSPYILMVIAFMFGLIWQHNLAIKTLKSNFDKSIDFIKESNAEAMERMRVLLKDMSTLIKK